MSLDEVGEMMLISIQNVCKNYRAGDIETAALKAVSYTHLTLPTKA